MKKTLLSLIFVAAITGCSIIPKSPYQQSAVVLDYSEYTNKGFFMTEANSVNFEYKAIGSVSAKVQSGYEIIGESVRKGMKDDIYGETYDKHKVKYGKYKQAFSDDAINVLCNKAMERGANGIINIKVTYLPAIRDLKTGIVIEPDAIIVTGMAIRK